VFQVRHKRTLFEIARAAGGGCGMAEPRTEELRRRSLRPPGTDWPGGWLRSGNNGRSTSHRHVMRQLVSGLVLGDDVLRNTTALIHLVAVRLRPLADSGALLAACTGASPATPSS
jgi:hypothetical protein